MIYVAMRVITYLLFIHFYFLSAIFRVSSGYLRGKCRSGYYKQKRQLRQLVELPLKYMNVSNVISRLNDTSLMFQLWD